MSTTPTNRMARAVSHLADRFMDFASETVSYTRGALSVAVQATRGRTPFERLDGGVVVAFESADFIIKWSLLTFDGSAVVIPRAGDRITDANGKVFEVNVPDNSAVYESIGGNLVVKIHTKAVSG